MQAALLAGLAVWALLALGAAVMMSLGTDEAWVLNGLRSVWSPLTPELSTELITTNGGLFALAHAAIELAVGSKLLAHRCLSVLCLGGMLWLAIALAGAELGAAFGRSGWALVLAVMLAVPGSAEVGIAVLGTSAGVLLLFATLHVWCFGRAPAWRRVVAAGLLFGFAIGSRLDLVVFAPAFLLVACVEVRHGRLAFRLDGQVIAMLTIAAVLAWLNQASIRFSAIPIDAQVRAEANGLSGLVPSYNKFATAASLAPLALLAVAAVAAFWPRGAAADAAPQPSQPSQPSLKALLLLGGVSMYLAWLIQSPIPHLRYLWPTLECFALLGAIALVRLQPAHGIACQIVALACVWGSIGPTVRSVALGDSDLVSWEWSNEIGLSRVRRFEAGPAQRQMAAYLRDGVPADAVVYSYLPYALRYLSARPIWSIVASPPAFDLGQRAQYLVLTPMVGSYYRLRPEATAWLAQNATLEREFGWYAIYKLNPGAEVRVRALVPVTYEYFRHPHPAP